MGDVYYRPISLAIRCSVGGCVLNNFNTPPPENGFMMYMCSAA